MKTAGIIAEYNPFHNGHLYQLEYVRNTLKADYIVIVMSGDFVQRGTPALLPKHVRAEMALRCGADLVLELPPSLATASAEFFAAGGVQLLDRLNVVDLLCFGSESGSVSPLEELAAILSEEPEEYRSSLQACLAQGDSFPAARQKALLSYFENKEQKEQIEEILSSPNNILGIEYCKALCRLKSRILPCTLKREGSGYHEKDLFTDQNPSASAIRKSLVSSQNPSAQLQSFIPKAAYSLFEEAICAGSFVQEDDLDLLLHYRLLQETAATMTEYLDLSPSLARRIENTRNQYLGFSHFVSQLKTKELTRTRIQRALLHMLLYIKEIPEDVPYARVLGFRKSSASLLSQIKKRSSIPLITKAADASAVLDEKGMKLFQETIFSSNVYSSILSSKTGTPFLHEFQKQLVIL